MDSAFLAVLLCAAAVVGPGALLLRSVAGDRLRPAEFLVGSVGLSLLLVYGATWTIYLLDAPRTAHSVVAAVNVLALLGCLPVLRDLFSSSKELRRMLASWGLFSAFSLVLLALVRSHSGGGWEGDWLEHYQRALFFLDHGAHDTNFLEIWPLPSRPPLMNLIETHVLASTGRSYPAYQIVSTLLSALVILPALLLTRLFTRAPQRIGILGAIFVLNPMLAQNATYSWTKLFAAFYALAGIAFYVTGIKLGSRVRVVLGFVFLAGGVLVHYSIAPYFLFVAGWEAVRAFWSRGRALGDAAWAAAASAILLATWLGWSAATFGVRGTLASTSTVAQGAHFTAGGLAWNAVRNVWWTLIPHALLDVDRSLIAQTSVWGQLRDTFFLTYQTNLVLGLGLGGALLLFLPRRRVASVRAFWIALTAFTAVTGIAVVSEVGTYGLAHLCLQALIVLGLTTAACRWGALPAWARRLAVVLFAIDFALGIALQFALESLPMDHVSAFAVHWPDHMPLGLSWTAYANALAKEQWDVTYLGDLVAPLRGAAALVALAVAGAALARLWRQAAPGVGRNRLLRSSSGGRTSGRRRRACPR
jgi:hypothetical protein